MTGTIIVVVVAALVVLLIVVALRSRGGTQLESLHAERRHDWEKSLNDAHEEALLRGVEAWRDRGHDLLLHHEGAKLDVLEPPMVVSLYALAEAFGRRDARDEIAGELLDRWAAQEEPAAALHLRRDALPPSATMGVEKLVSRARAAIDAARADTSGIEHASADDRRGVLELTVKADGPTNTVVIDLGRAAETIQRKQDDGDETPWADLANAELRGAVARDAEGVLWMRPPSAAERAMALGVIERAP
ncbi:MAG: hypothetical protein HYV09_31725 [Deltaproteobacteria bacterium]|nr:hypothetical protein [Deltaproteobacteria bacterium]